MRKSNQHSGLRSVLFDHEAKRVVVFYRDKDEPQRYVEFHPDAVRSLVEQLEAQTEIVAAAREVYEGWLAGEFDWDRLAAALERNDV